MAANAGGDAKSSVTDIKQAGSVLSAAWSELLALALEAGKKKAGDAVSRTLSPALDGPSSAVGALIENYSQYLGDIARALPAVGRYLAAQLKPENQSTGKLLLQVSPEGLPKELSNLWRLTAQRSEEIEKAGRVYELYVTAETRKRLPPLDRLSGLATLLQETDVINLDRVLDELKYDFRRRSFEAIPDIRNKLKLFLDPVAELQSRARDERLHATIEALALHEQVARRILSDGFLRQYVDSSKEEEIGRRILEYLQKRFQEIGIELADRLSELVGLHEPPRVRVEPLYATFEALAPALGEQVTRRILSDGLLRHYLDPIEEDENRRKILEYLRERFRTIGIELSDRLSQLVGRRDGLILDHKNDRVYEVRSFPDRHDIYGAREGRRYRVGGSKDVLLPVRVMDASQGFVVWSIDKRFVQEHLETRRTRLEAWDTGGGMTPIVLSVAQHREGDLGPYEEITLGCLATPPGNPLAVGMWMLSQTPVTTKDAAEASKAIWGFEKERADIKVTYRGNSSTWTLGGGAEGLEFTLPRGGDGSSMSVPMLVYTRKDPGHNNLSPLNRTLIIRNGQGEQVRGGGAGVSLSVNGGEKKEPHEICYMLRRLGLVIGKKGEKKATLARTPTFSVWTEHVSGEAHAPALVVLPRDAA